MPDCCAIARNDNTCLLCRAISPGLNADSYLTAAQGELKTKTNWLFALKPRWALTAFVVIDIICFGMGMGVPVFCILFGFLVGWYIVRNVTANTPHIREVLRKIFRYAVITSSFTFVLSAVAWGRCITWLFDANADLANFGIPMILFEPRASFIGWLVLMIAVSPFLQLLTTLFSSHLALLRWVRTSSQNHNT